jgi:hypothetical protein
MQRFQQVLRHVGAVALLAQALGACSSDVNLGSVNILPKPETFTRPDWLSFSGGKHDFALRPVTADDLVTQQGQCAADRTVVASAPNDASAADAASDATAAPQPTPLQQGGIALQMTECDVVRRSGAPENIEFGTNERGERAVVLTYTRGPRPGVYRFTEGRLAAIERAPGPPQPEKPQKPAKAAKKPART